MYLVTISAEDRPSSDAASHSVKTSPLLFWRLPKLLSSYLAILPVRPKPLPATAVSTGSTLGSPLHPRMPHHLWTSKTFQLFRPFVLLRLEEPHTAPQAL